jgi:hypothetical protein
MNLLFVQFSLGPYAFSSTVTSHTIKLIRCSVHGGETEDCGLLIYPEGGGDMFFTKRL